MKLSVFERLTALNILPKEGDLVSLKLIRQLKENLGFTEDELEKLDFHYEYKCDKCGFTLKVKAMQMPGECHECAGPMVLTGQVYWEHSEDGEVEIDISRKAHELIANKLEELDKQKKLTEAHISLCEKFMEEE